MNCKYWPVSPQPGLLAIHHQLHCVVVAGHLNLISTYIGRNLLESETEGHWLPVQVDLIVPGPGVAIDCAPGKKIPPQRVGLEINVSFCRWVPAHDAENFHRVCLLVSISAAYQSKVAVEPLTRLRVSNLATGPE